MLWYARSQRWDRASSRSSVARRIRHLRFMISSVLPDLGRRRICRVACEPIAARRRCSTQAPRAAEGEPPVPAHAEFIFCDQSIERTLAWLSRCRRLCVRYERRADIHEAFLILCCALIYHSYLRHRF